MKKIVLLNGCYERIETLPLASAKAFIKGLNENNSYEVVTINLYDKNIEYCTGCKECITNEHKCCICDDLKHIFDKLDDARYIIWVAPIYSLSFPSKINALLERILAFNIKYEQKMPPCKHILFSTCGLYSYENKFEELIKYFDVFFEKATLKLLCPAEGDEYILGDEGSDLGSIKHFEEVGQEYRIKGGITLESKKKLYGSFMPKDVLYKLFEAIIEEGESDNPYYYISDITTKKDIGKDTNIVLLFLPWIAMCLFMPLSSELAGTIALTFCSLIPILSFKYMLTTYDRISISAAIIISLFLLFSGEGIYVETIAYFIIGALFMGSLLTDIPISAYYIYKYYWDIKSFTKDRFIKVNRIISASWGGSLLLVSIMNNFLMSTKFRNYIGVMIIIVFELFYIIAIYAPKGINRNKEKSS